MDSLGELLFHLYNFFLIIESTSYCWQASEIKTLKAGETGNGMPVYIVDCKLGYDWISWITPQDCM